MLHSTIGLKATVMAMNLLVEPEVEFEHYFC
jgi:hypothetical protein